jgi:quercetin dioxygenase-like cupin family protein
MATFQPEDPEMRRRMLLRLHSLSFALIAAHAVAGNALAEQTGYPAATLLSTGVSAVGEPIHYATTGPAKITAAIVTIAPGAKTIRHKHGVPMFAYILDGAVTVDYGADGKRTYRKGDAFMEAMNVLHSGLNEGAEPVRILVVYMGAQGAENVIADK